MNLKDYINEKKSYLYINLCMFFFMAFIIKKFHAPLIIIGIIFCCWFLPLMIWFWVDFSSKKDFYKSLINGVESLDQKYLLQTIIKEPEFIEGKISYHVLRETNRSFHEEINKYKFEQLEYREYIESWVHEIKTPIAASKLIIDNRGDARTIYEELNKIEEYIEQVLYYARSTEVCKDYIVREFPLKDIVNNVLKKHAKSFIHKKIKLELKGLEQIAYSDTKWVEFIINQIIINSINYSQGHNNCIRIYTKEQKNNIILVIEDSGIGIDERDLPRIFEKGFTGENGRIHGKSTGMGLYICKKLAMKLYIGLEVESKKNVGTKVLLIFPRGKVFLDN